MKHLKTYEQNKIPDYEHGDTLKFKIKVWNTTDKKYDEWYNFMTVKSVYVSNNLVSYVGYILYPDNKEEITINEKDIIEKIKKEDAQTIIDASLYNL